MLMSTFFSLHTVLYLSLSLFLFLLNLFFPIMMSFCRKSVHSFLSLTAASVDSTAADHHHHHNLDPPWKSQTLGLVTATNDIRRRSPNVLQSSSMIINKYSSSPTSSPPPPPTRKKDPGGIGFIDDIGGGVNGLLSCTESLGFESSDERRVDDYDEDQLSLLGHDVRPWRSKKEKWGKKTCRSTDTVKKFPPPLSSLNRNGQPSFFLLPVRKDGRLELTEVRIHRPEILRSYRGDGRLRLHLFRDDEAEDGDDNEDEDYINVEEEEHDDDDNIEEEKVKENVIREEEEEEEERNVHGDEWKIPVSSSGEGFRRCHEVVNHHNHHHHHLHMWRQQDKMSCVLAK